MKVKKETIVHIVILSIIVVILGIAVFRLVRWNQSNQSEANNVETDENFDTETEDFIAIVNPKYLEGRDDGITTIVMLGDSMLSNYPEKDGIAEQTASLANATVYDCSFANSYLACDSSSLNGYDAFSLFAVVNAIAAGDFSHLKTVLEDGSVTETSYQNTIKKLESIDFEKVDVLTILYGPFDYLNGKEITNPQDMNDITTYSGALKASVEVLKKAYPHLRIITTSPTYCLVEDAGTITGCDIVDTGYGTLPAYMIAAKNIAVMTSTTYLDNYLGLPIGEDTAADYLEENIYPNKEGRKMIAERIVNTLD